MSVNVIILTPKKFSPRHKYVFDFIFCERFGIKYSTTTSSSQFSQKENSIKINYSGQLIDRTPCLHVPNMGLLDEQGIRELNVQTQTFNKIIRLFPTEQSGFQVNNDLFSAVFYLLSRYEEYLPFTADKHDRFTAAVSFAKQNGFHRLPLIDIWLKELSTALKRLDKNFTFSTNYTFQTSYDIDIAWAYKNKGFARGILQKVRTLFSLNYLKSKQLFEVAIGIKKDPYFKFSYFNDLEKRFKTQASNYFFAFGKWGTYDKNNPTSNKNFRQLIQNIDKTNPVGIHPSYSSNKDVSILRKEVNDLAALIENPLKRSRQHYLKMSLPTTYRNLEKLNIKEDHSMGYADDVGFRASTAYDFFWYDVLEDRISELRIYPFQIMEVALFNYLKIDTAEAESICTTINQSIRENGGTFSILWHNSSFNEVENWTMDKQLFYEKVLQIGADT